MVNRSYCDNIALKDLQMRQGDTKKKRQGNVLFYSDGVFFWLRIKVSALKNTIVKRCENHNLIYLYSTLFKKCSIYLSSICVCGGIFLFCMFSPYFPLVFYCRFSNCEILSGTAE